MSPKNKVAKKKGPETIAKGKAEKRRERERTHKMEKLKIKKEKNRKSQCCIKLLFGQVIDTLSQWEMAKAEAEAEGDAGYWPGALATMGAITITRINVNFM